MCQWGTVTALPAPAWSERSGKRIAIDSCIADVVALLWDRDIRTEGSCCGHLVDRPSLVLPTHDNTIAARAYEALSDCDPDRRWLLLQWQLVDVTPAMESRWA